MGGSSFLFTCASIGIVLSVARNLEQMEGKISPETDNEEGAEAPVA
jgi:cell division protein FtsW